MLRKKKIYEKNINSLQIQKGAVADVKAIHSVCLT